jgi:hypothetical protein
VRFDGTAHVVGMGLHHNAGRRDDERRRVHHEVDHHVMDREGLVVLREEQRARLSVAHGAAQQERAVLVAVGLHAVDPVVEGLGVDAVEVAVEVRVVPHPSYLGGPAPLGPNARPSLWVRIAPSVRNASDSDVFRTEARIRTD